MFITRSLPALAAFVLLTAVAGCAKAAHESPIAGARNPWTIPGVLRFGTVQEPHTLNPMLENDIASFDVAMFVYSWAILYDSKAHPIPDALREVPTVANGDVSSDGLTLRYKLRRNIRWQDGPPLTCGDLKFTWQAVMNPHNNVAGTDGYRDIRTIDCSDPYVAVIHMSRVYAPFLQELWSIGGGAPILPAHLLARYNDDKGSFNTASFNSLPVGSGPFKVIDWKRGQEIRMVANPNFYLGAPKLKEVIFEILSDPNTVELQLIKHEIDLAKDTPENSERLAALVADPRSGLKQRNFDRFVSGHIDFNVSRPILNDRSVRVALAYATNRNEIIQKLYGGRMIPAETDQHPKLSWAYTTNVSHYPFDLAKARAILDADGWKVGPDGIRTKNGTRLELLLSMPGTATELSGGWGETELFLQREWRGIGVQADIKNYEPRLFFVPAGILNAGHYDIAMLFTVGASDPDDSGVYSGDDLAPRGSNTVRWNNPLATAAMRDALLTVDQTRRKRDYVVVQQQLMHDVPTIILGFAQGEVFYNSDLKGFDSTPVDSIFWNTWNYSI